MKTLKSWVCGIGVLTFSLMASASTSEVPEGYFDFQAPEVQLLSSEEPLSFPMSTGLVGDCSGLTSPRANWESDMPGNPLDQLNQVELVLDKVINIGKKLWGLLEKGKPVVNLKSDVATALPQGARCWLDLQGWSKPKSTLYGVSYKNLYGIEVVNFKFRLLSLTSGSVDGKGQYIGYAAVMPAQVDVAWGYSLTAQVDVQSVFNMGTKENPIGGLQLAIQYKVETVMKSSQESVVFFVDGQGNRERLQ